MKSESKSIGLTETLATFIHDITYDKLPADIVEIAKGRILDSLSSAYGGRDLAHSRTAVEIARNFSGNSTIFGYNIKTTLPYALIANGVLAHSILQEDQIGGHPSTMIPPAGLGVAEQEKSTGKETILAIVLGYDMLIRLARSVSPLVVKTFRSGPMYGTFGAAAVAGKLMKLDIVQITNALGYAVTLAPGVCNEGWWSGTMEPAFEAGWAIKIGIELTTIAKGGATVSPYALEGRHGFLRCWAGKIDGATFLTDDLGKTFLMKDVQVKPYPACGGNQLLIQTGLQLSKYKLKAKDIVKVIIKSATPLASSGHNFAGPYLNQFQAQMSDQFCASAALLGKPVESVSLFAA